MLPQNSVSLTRFPNRQLLRLMEQIRLSTLTCS
jgi:hypothetical protein